MNLPTVTVANKSKVIVKSGFNNYDLCINPYVGCGFGCSYCYVRFFIRDPKLAWGEFVRVREHIQDQLPKELRKGQINLTEGREQDTDDEGKPLTEAILDKDGKATGKFKPVTKPKHRMLAIPDARLVIGTMTDPYQPKEVKYRITRTILDTLLDPQYQSFKKVGLFTRSPLVLQDLERIVKLPQARIHFTVTPFPHPIMRAIEPYSPNTPRRWDTVKKLKEAGLRVHVNVSPVMPGMSEDLIDEWVEKLVELQVDEYFVDPMQPYKESFAAFKTACQGVAGVDWFKTEAIMTDRDRYLDWKFDFFQKWNKSREKIQDRAPKQFPIWCDHENKVWVDMRTGQQMDQRFYGAEAIQ